MLKPGRPGSRHPWVVNFGSEESFEIPEPLVLGG
jgi:hypothetical protein